MARGGHYAFPLALPRPQPVRRALNVMVASLGILLTLPLWVVIALAIKLTSRGPIFYTQTRVGLDRRRSGIRMDDPRRQDDAGGRMFRLVKFRTMGIDAERGIGETWADPEDGRVTAVGRLLRLYRLDELPQLINVLRGDMNVVGPRPERPGIFATMRNEIPNYHLRQRTYPGITGNAQVNLGYDSSVDDVRKKVEKDLEYLERASVWEDLRIMIKTIPVMLFRRGSR